jgi:hypothetical protein
MEIEPLEMMILWRFTLWETNIAIENGQFIVDLPI